MKPQFIVHRHGVAYVLYAGLLDRAHESGLVRIATTLLQAPDESVGGRAIVAAEVQTQRGTFAGIGEAMASDVGLRPHSLLIDAAELRAKAKALRDALNIHLESIEERFGPEAGREEMHDIQPAGFSPVDPIRDEIRQLAPPGPRALTGKRDEPGHCGSAEGSSRDLERPATANQLATIEKLSRVLGSAEDVHPGISTIEASMRIAELARLFNDRGPTVSSPGKE